MTTTILLGPQRFLTTAGAVVRGLGIDGPVATVTAGWEDRESDDAELDAVLAGRSRNLGLYGRLVDVLDRDAHFASAALRHRDAMDDLAAIYSIRLEHALEAVYAVCRRQEREDLVAAGCEDAIAAVRALDAWYLDRVRALYGDLAATGTLERSEVVARHRAEVADLLAGSVVLAVAGGHVGLLLRCLRLFDVRPPAGLPVVAWSAGAMAMTSRVVLFHDHTAQGFTGAQVWDRGLHRAPGIVAFPHARRRLHLDDRTRMAVLARRFAGCACVLLDDGSKTVLGPDGSLPAGARYLADDGTVATVAAGP